MPRNVAAPANNQGFKIIIFVGAWQLPHSTLTVLPALLMSSKEAHRVGSGQPQAQSLMVAVLSAISAMLMRLGSAWSRWRRGVLSIENLLNAGSCCAFDLWARFLSVEAGWIRGALRGRKRGGGRLLKKQQKR